MPTRRTSRKTCLGDGRKTDNILRFSVKTVFRFVEARRNAHSKRSLSDVRVPRSFISACSQTFLFNNPLLPPDPVAILHQ